MDPAAIHQSAVDYFSDLLATEQGVATPPDLASVLSLLTALQKEAIKWDETKLHTVLLGPLVEQIVAIPFDDLAADRAWWKDEAKGLFTTKSAWGLIRTQAAAQPILSDFWHPVV
ncbi:hypothetical protein Salat_0874100 [Sesamum alatum]|uniref:Uncharacterized protein n=1 Tax=Sesamum alatum TaxID=300844 RepID=A0AAE2CQT2_9LAMI|nr:hypothetical protein Salat_0874100 [Sesamum alatum]